MAEQGEGLKVLQLRVGPMANFVYLLFDRESKNALVIDSGWETEPVVKATRETGARVGLVVATHEHFDHTSTLSKLAEELGAKVVAWAGSPIHHDVAVDEGQELALGTQRIRILHTPGHTADSICLYDGRSVFTGDTLFIGTIGRFEPKMAETIYRSLFDVILRLPKGTVIYPGHDYGDVPSRTIGEERVSNPFLGARNLREFLSLVA